MKVTVLTRNNVRTTIEQAHVVSQVGYGSWVAVTLKDGRVLQLQKPVAGCAFIDKKSFINKLD